MFVLVLGFTEINFVQTIATTSKLLFGFRFGQEQLVGSFMESFSMTKQLRPSFHLQMQCKVSAVGRLPRQCHLADCIVSKLGGEEIMVLGSDL